MRIKRGAGAVGARVYRINNAANLKSATELATFEGSTVTKTRRSALACAACDPQRRRKRKFRPETDDGRLLHGHRAVGTAEKDDCVRAARIMAAE